MLSCRGGGKLSRPVYLDPHPPEYQSKNNFANSTYFKLSECDDVSIINIIQVKFSCFLCQIILYASLHGWGGGGKLSRPVYLAPHPPGYQSKVLCLFFLF